MSKIKTVIATMLVAFGLIGAQLLATPTYAAIDPTAQACAGTGGHISDGTCTGNSTKSNLTAIIKTIVNVLLYLIGVIAVIVIIVGGFRYVTSNGDASKVKGAKDTILYAVIGLIVAILAYAIVNFVVGAIAK